MAKAIPYAIRALIVKRRQDQEPLTTIAKDLGLSYDGVCKIWRNYRREGEQSLELRYGNCGRKPLYDKSLRDHIMSYRENEGACEFGAPYIRSKLIASGQYAIMPHERTIQYWFRQKGINRTKGRGPSRPGGYATQAHEHWQGDGKENVELADDSNRSYFSISDEAHGVFLGAKVFPPDTH